MITAGQQDGAGQSKSRDLCGSRLSGVYGFDRSY
jgi:hypothetical protein